MLAVAPPDSEIVRDFTGSIAEAERRLGRAPVVVEAPAAAPKAASGAAPGIAGTVVLSPELAGKVPADATLFAFARSINGSGIPLAMARVKGARLPHTLRLDDSMSMAPNVKMSSAKPVILGARLSRSGDAIAKSGDFEGFSDPVDLGRDNVNLRIGTVVK